MPLLLLLPLLLLPLPLPLLLLLLLLVLLLLLLPLSLLQRGPHGPATRISICLMPRALLHRLRSLRGFRGPEAQSANALLHRLRDPDAQSIVA
jgi:hypothetical protein